MEKEKIVVKNKCYNHGGGGAIYGLGVIGAAVYFIQHATDSGMAILGIFKAIFWPAILMYRLLGYLKF